MLPRLLTLPRLRDGPDEEGERRVTWLELFYDLVFVVTISALASKSVGGQVLGEAIAMLASGGTCVTFGISAATEAAFDIQNFYFMGGASLYGFIIFHEVLAKPASEGLARLSRLLEEGRLRPHVSVEASWAEAGEVTRQLLDRGFTGKAVLRVGE